MTLPTSTVRQVSTFACSICHRRSQRPPAQCRRWQQPPTAAPAPALTMGHGHHPQLSTTMTHNYPNPNSSIDDHYQHHISDDDDSGEHSHIIRTRGAKDFFPQPSTFTTSTPSVDGWPGTIRENGDGSSHQHPSNGKHSLTDRP